MSAALGAKIEERRSGGETPIAPSLFEGSAEVRVSDLVGDLARQEAVSAPFPVTPARRRGGRLTLDWYDWGVLALILSSAIAGVVCLLMGH